RRFVLFRGSGLRLSFALARGPGALNSLLLPLLQRELMKRNDRGSRVVSHGTAPAGCNGYALRLDGEMPAPTPKIKCRRSSRNDAQHLKIHFRCCSLARFP